jgi:hypothetical protein
VYNFGISGYGTDQEYLLIRSLFDSYNPKIVFLVFCIDNDYSDNSRNNVYGGYFEPYFIEKDGALELSGVPVPHSKNYGLAAHKIMCKSYLLRVIVTFYSECLGVKKIQVKDPTLAIISSLNKFITGKGADFIIGLQDKDPKLEKFLTDNKIAYLCLGNSLTYPLHGKHWTPEGHSYVSNEIYKFLVHNKYVN